MRVAVALLFAAVVILLVWCFVMDSRMAALERAVDRLVISVVRVPR